MKSITVTIENVSNGPHCDLYTFVLSVFTLNSSSPYLLRTPGLKDRGNPSRPIHVSFAHTHARRVSHSHVIILECCDVCLRFVFIELPLLIFISHPVGRAGKRRSEETGRRQVTTRHSLSCRCSFSQLSARSKVLFKVDLYGR